MNTNLLTSDNILMRAQRVLHAEGNAVLNQAESLGEEFCTIVRLIYRLKGRVVATGVGKSGIIAKKIAATLASTGTPAFFLNPVDAVHGDLGMVGPDDMLLALSNSGETQEILTVLFAAKKLGACPVGVTGEAGSTLAQSAEYLLPVVIEKEACPLGLAPTTSTTVLLAVGDAIALTLLELRGFTDRDYARYHPGGSLGRRLRLGVRDFMRTGDRLPVVAETDTLRRAIEIMTEKESLGVTLVCDAEGRLSGIVTDGDLRRILQKEPDPAALFAQPVKKHMTADPLTVEADTTASDALRRMEVRSITSLAIVYPNGRPAGIVHLHDILGRSQFFV